MKSKHCQLCEHKNMHILTGTTCKLTEKKPNFNYKCKDIKWGKNLKNSISNLYIDIKKNDLQTNLVYLNFVVFFTLSLVAFYYCYYLFVKSYNNDFVLFRLPLLVFVAGTILLGYSFNPLLRYIRDRNDLKRKKKELDQLLELYRVDFSIDVDYEKDAHGNKTFHYDLKVF